MDSYGDMFNRELDFQDKKSSENSGINNHLILSGETNEVACFCLLVCGKHAIPFSNLINIWYGDPLSFRDNLRFLIVNHYMIAKEDGMMPVEGVDKVLASHLLGLHTIRLCKC